LRDSFIWRVRNITYPKEVYQVTLDPNERKITIRTTNKKYFKKFEIPGKISFPSQLSLLYFAKLFLLDLNRKKLPYEEANLSWKYENNTLIILYKKPKEILIDEEKARQERANLKFLTL
jgi:hypothetical protein